jgi:hypothetical protein
MSGCLLRTGVIYIAAAAIRSFVRHRRSFTYKRRNPLLSTGLQRDPAFGHPMPCSHGRSKFRKRRDDAERQLDRGNPAAGAVPRQQVLCSFVISVQMWSGDEGSTGHAFDARINEYSTVAARPGANLSRRDSAGHPRAACYPI